ncbi:MAG: succinylglutamate desuccinylase/aspartoacylase family protein [Alphaproteobacteria bacterium]|nr:succinylglutamate desuccinylase/aspartoacylase family protein [Alphaproteobacteria bacterium]
MPRSVHQLRTSRRDTVPVLVHEASAGPVVAITANIHGDEATGVAVVQELDRWLAERLLKGAVVLYPSLNPAGLSNRTRVLPPDGADLNRLFPGHRDGSESERHAASIWKDLAARRVGLVIDLHADSARSIPYAIVDRALARGRGAKLAPMLEKYAAASGLTVLREYPDDQYVRYSLDRSLAGAMVNRGAVPAITVEAGPRRWISAPAVAAAADAVRGVLGCLGLVDFPGVRHPTRVDGGPWRRAPAPRARVGGIFRERLEPGARFDKGDVLGSLVDLSGAQLDEIVAPGEGVVISWAEVTWVDAGAVPGTVGLLEA